MQVCVPLHPALALTEYRALEQFINSARRLVVLTGAGLSTESGIPDYRSEGVGLYDRTKHRPIQHMDFMNNKEDRRRYWARNYMGHTSFASKVPNIGHRALVKMEQQGKLHWLITQNVDRLHQSAGSKRLTELHGTTNVVKCEVCQYSTDRNNFQDYIRYFNPDFTAEIINITPDADAEIDKKLIKQFNIPPCPDCGGDMIKPQVVFFGANVHQAKVAHCYGKVDEADALLTVGSSLQVMSGYRFILHAAKQQKPIAILNIGETRADPHASLKIKARAGEFFSRFIGQEESPRIDQDYYSEPFLE